MVAAQHLDRCDNDIRGNDNRGKDVPRGTCCGWRGRSLAVEASGKVVKAFRINGLGQHCVQPVSSPRLRCGGTAARTRRKCYKNEQKFSKIVLDKTGYLWPGRKTETVSGLGTGVVIGYCGGELVSAE